MLTVLPIQDKNVQKELCELCGASFDAYSFAGRKALKGLKFAIKTSPDLLYILPL